MIVNTAKRITHRKRIVIMIRLREALEAIVRVNLTERIAILCILSYT